MGIPLIKAKTHGEKERELEDLKTVLINLKNKGVEAIFAGALASEYQKSRIDQLCNDIGLISKAPLWHVNPKEYMEEIIDSGFEVIIISVSAEGLDRSWLGRRIDHELLEEIITLNSKYPYMTGLQLILQSVSQRNSDIFRYRLFLVNLQHTNKK